MKVSNLLYTDLDHWCSTGVCVTKLSIAKEMASIIGNYTNLPYTLAKCHQQQQCYHFASTATYVSVARDTLWKRCMNVLAPAN